MTFRIASWNVNSLRARLAHVLTWLEQQQPDIVGLQETKVTDDLFPKAELEQAGYQVVFSGQKSYNGVAILSKQVARDTVTDFPDFDDPMRRVLGATYGDVRVINLYVPNGSSIDSDKFQYKLRWLASLQTFLAQQIKCHNKLIVLGDFNIAPADQDVHDPQAWAGSVHVSPPERAALQAILKLGLDDVFRQFLQADNSFSWWDYRQGAFRRNRGLRIDLLLTSKALSTCCQQSVIDREPRTWEKPSDHAPVFADFSLCSNGNNDAK